MKKKVDKRIHHVIENGVNNSHRSVFVIVGEKGKDIVAYLHHMLSKASVKQASVLWCYKNKLNISLNVQKKQKRANQMYRSVDESKPFDMFLLMTKIRYCYYKETHKILGNTFKMCVIQDFEAVTPNILCRAIETVVGGGLVVILLQSIISLKQLYTLNMDVHARFRTESHKYVVPRFNERFILSLTSCKNCIIMDDKLTILPISTHLRNLHSEVLVRKPFTTKNEEELELLNTKASSTEPLGKLIKLCKTFDQARVVLEFIMAITEKTLDKTMVLTAARGRGKSAAMGIALASAIYFGYSNLYATSPSPENLNAFFEFFILGLKSLGYEEALHYQVLRTAAAEHNKAVVKVTVSQTHRQILQYISPNQQQVLSHAEILVIDEAAAIPLPHVQSLLGSYLVFMSSTVSGYEGTGRSLSLKLVDSLREKENGKEKEEANRQCGTKLRELSMEESIRYRDGDPIEKWLHDLLCLDNIVQPIINPQPLSTTTLYYVNRDALFSYHKSSESFLKCVFSLLTASHYRNSPDDLQILSDAPAHHLFVLMPKNHEIENAVDETHHIYCVIQVVLEGKISKESVEHAIGEGIKPSGDLIPWTISNVFLNYEFPQLSGARIIRIATHPHLQKKGYGSHAVRLLKNYYKQGKTSAPDNLKKEEMDTENRIALVDDEQVSDMQELGNEGDASKKEVVLLESLNKRPAELLDYIGVAHGVTEKLLKFWKKEAFSLVYLSQQSNAVTGEHTAVLLWQLQDNPCEDSWVRALWWDFRGRMLSLLGGSFKHFNVKFAVSLLKASAFQEKHQAVAGLSSHLTVCDIRRLEAVVHNQQEVTFINDILVCVGALYFAGKMPHFKLTPVQMVILCGIGIQRKPPLVIAQELQLDASVIYSKLHSIVHLIIDYVNETSDN